MAIGIFFCFLFFVANFNVWKTMKLMKQRLGTIQG